jgi:hypothetical protein
VQKVVRIFEIISEEELARMLPAKSRRRRPPGQPSPRRRLKPAKQSGRTGGPVQPLFLPAIAFT